MSKSTDLATKLMFSTLTILKNNDGELSRAQLMLLLAEEKYLDSWAKEPLAKTGYIRWTSILQFYTIDLLKAGFMLKNKGVWYLTPEGEQALEKGEKGLFKAAQDAYKKWKLINKPKAEIEVLKEVKEDVIEEETLTSSSILDEAKSKANQSFRKFIIENFDPYSFQDLCGALFRGMGYYTPFIAPKGKDGGVDVIAYKDPIGSATPHIKIQVKYKQDTKASSQELRQLKGILTNNV